MYLRVMYTQVDELYCNNVISTMPMLKPSECD